MFFSEWRMSSLMNRFNGWSDRIINLHVDFIEQELALWYVGVTAIVRIILKDGTYHENLGFAESRNISKGIALQEAKFVFRIGNLTMVERREGCSTEVLSPVRFSVFPIDSSFIIGSFCQSPGFVFFCVCSWCFLDWTLWLRSLPVLLPWNPIRIWTLHSTRRSNLFTLP